MFIWPFGRPALVSEATVVTPAQQPSWQPTFEHTKMEKEKEWMSKPEAVQKTASFPTRRLRPTRRFIAVTLIAMIMLCNIQPLFRSLTIPSQDLDKASCRHRYPNLRPCAGLHESSVDSDFAGTHKIQHSAQDVKQKQELVPLEAHIMSKCPDAQDCLVDLIVPAMQRVSDKVNFTLSFIGDIDPDETVHCKHGEDECVGNMMMLCAAKIYPDPKISLGFSTCLIRDYDHIPGRALAQGCALEHAVDFEKLNNCMSEEGDGLELLKASITRSSEKKIERSCTVRLNDEVRCIRDDGEWVNCDDGSEPGDLIRDIDALYK